MNKRFWSATCAAIVLGVTAAALAQTPPSSSPSQPPSASAADKAITVTGCVQQAKSAPTGTSGTASPSARADETKFVLTNAAMSASGATGTSGTPSTAVASEYRLDADDAKLTSHVGHKVEITGTIDQPSRAATQPPAASAANAPKLKVDSVKMIAATCP